MDPVKLTQTEQESVRDYLRARYASYNPKAIKIEEDGAVTVHVDRTPNFDKPVRIFVGWGADLLRVAS